MTKWALALLALALLITCYFLFRDTGTPEAVIAGPAEPVPEVATPREPLELGTPVPEAPPSVRSEVEAVAEDEPEDGADPEPVAAPEERLRFEARVVEVLASGVEVDVESGEIELLFWAENRASHHELPILGGRVLFDGGVEEAAIPGTDDAPSQVQASSVSLDGETYRLLDRDRRYPFDRADVVIRVQRLTALVLNVVDDETGAHLDDVTITKVTNWRRNRLGHPGDVSLDEGRIQGASPFEMSADRRDLNGQGTTLFVGSPGYAWARVEVLMDAGGERWVRMERGGDLTVIFDREVQRHGANLRLRSKPGSPFAEIAAHGRSEVEFTGLAPAKYEVIMETGDWWDKTFRLAAGEVEVVAGGHAELRLSIEEPPEVEKAALSGTIVLPKAWGSDRFYLVDEFRGVILDGGNGRKTLHHGSFSPVAGEVDTFTFDFGQVQVGEHVLTLSKVEYAVLVDVGPAGERDVRIELPRRSRSRSS